MNSARFIVPPIWPLELLNALNRAVRKGRIDAEHGTSVYRGLMSMPLEIVPLSREELLDDLPGLANRHGLSPYDASYLLLAARRGLLLATADKALIRAARTDGIGLF